LKICFAGDWGIGKTSLILRYVDDVFTLETKKTLQTDFKQKVVQIEGSQIKVRVFDTAGQERFKTITASYYRGAHGVIFVYDVTEVESFANLTQWIDEVQRYANEDVNRVIVGNKIDSVEERAIDLQRAKEFAAKEGIQYYETSAKTGENVEQVFTELVQAICNRMQVNTRPRSNTATKHESKKIKIDEKPPKQDHSKDCKC